MLGITLNTFAVHGVDTHGVVSLPSTSNALQTYFQQRIKTKADAPELVQEVYLVVPNRVFWRPLYARAN